MATSTKVPFAELAAKTSYSFLEGASHPEEMVLAASTAGYEAIAITDAFGVYGAPRAHVAAKAGNFPLVVGAEIPINGKPFKLLAKNRNGYGNLCELLTIAHENRENPSLDWDKVHEKHKGLFLLIPSSLELSEEFRPTLSVFENNCALLVSTSQNGSDSRRILQAEQLSKKFNLRVAASNEPLFHTPERKPLQDVLTCIRLNCSLAEGGLRLLPNAERYIKPLPALQKLFASHLNWLENSAEIASDCRFSLDEIRYRYPTEWIPAGETGDTYLEKLVYQGAKQRYGENLPNKAKETIQHELQLIRELKYSDYFLTIWDIVTFARTQGILCQGRGSAANSVVCYVLEITSIDPVHLNLLFERFISRERNEPPDIDIDFEHERREEVIQYIYRRYGRHRAAITAEVICFRKKSSLREVAKVFDIPVDKVEKIQTLSHRRKLSEVPDSDWNETFSELPAHKVSLYRDLVQSLIGFPRHLGTHVGGFVLCQEALTRNVPIEKAAMADRTIVQWDKNDLDAFGFVRVDILGLGILTAIRKSFDYIKQTEGISLSLATIPQEDPQVYEPICRADTVGVFQIESRAQMNMLPRLKPRTFYDLVVEISLVRPGPIQGDMVHPYLKRRTGEESVEYAHPLLKGILEKTYGVPLFQEQIMKMAMTVAGFTGGEADELRRAMGSWRRDGANRLAPIGERFRKGLVNRGVNPEYAERVFHQIQGFAEYGFPESHAASFAVLVYATAYLKRYFPAAFLTGLLNAQPMGFYSPHSLIHDGKRHGIEVLPVDIQNSRWDNLLVSKHQVRLGYRQIRGMKKRVGEALEAARTRGGPFVSFEDFLERLLAELPLNTLTKRDLFLLAGANAFDCLGLERRIAFWKIQALCLTDSDLFSAPTEAVALKKETNWEKISADHEAQGVSLHAHPLALFRTELTKLRVLSSQDLAAQAERRLVQVAGLVICRQMPPTASGVLFITLEDENGFTNLVVWKKVFEAYRETLLTQSFLRCEGRIQKSKGSKVVHLVVEKAFPLLELSQSPAFASHDFH